MNNNLDDIITITSEIHFNTVDACDIEIIFKIKSESAI